MHVLAISPRFAPLNGADTHRLRLLLKHAATGGWSVEVLCVYATSVDGPVDPWLEEQLPANVPVHRVNAWSLKGWGLNGLAQRSFWPLYRRGCELLSTSRFDLIFFSTTEFALHVLGPLWHRKYGVPFCMDYQDPWVNDYYRIHREIVPPGGRLKYAVASRLHRSMERYVVRRCSGFLAVSRTYLDELQQRYGESARGKPMLVCPFPAEPDEISSIRSRTRSEEGERITKIWRYIGRGGPDMEKAALGFFMAWERAINEGLLEAGDAQLETAGTSYAAAGTGEKSLEPLVSGSRLEGCVQEVTDRLSYHDMLAKLFESDALVVFGSDDPAYTASKAYPYLLAERPLLAIFHENSSVVEIMHKVGGGVCVTFNERTSLEDLAADILHTWFEPRQYSRTVPLDAEAFLPYTAKQQANDISNWFRSTIKEFGA